MEDDGPESALEGSKENISDSADEIKKEKKGSCIPTLSASRDLVVALIALGLLNNAAALTTGMSDEALEALRISSLENYSPEMLKVLKGEMSIARFLKNNDPNLDPRRAIEIQEALLKLFAIVVKDVGMIDDVVTEQDAKIDALSGVLTNVGGTSQDANSLAPLHGLGGARAAFASLRNHDSSALVEQVFGGLSADRHIMAAVSDVEGQVALTNQTTVWVQGYGTFGETDATSGPGRNKYTAYGTALGLNHVLREGTTLGISTTYSRSNSDDNLRNAETVGNTYRIGVSGSQQFGAASLSGSFTFGYSDNKSERFISALGATAEGDYSSRDYSFAATAARLFLVDEYLVTPSARLRYTHSRTDGYTETGAGVANTTQDANSSNNVQGSLGVSVSRSYVVGEETVLTPQFRTAYNRDFNDNDRVADLSVIGTGFQLGSITSPKNTGSVGGGAHCYLRR